MDIFSKYILINALRRALDVKYPAGMSRCVARKQHFFCVVATEEVRGGARNARAGY
jgi:hypothetical protein